MNRYRQAKAVVFHEDNSCLFLSAEWQAWWTGSRRKRLDRCQSGRGMAASSTNLKWGGSTLISSSDLMLAFVTVCGWVEDSMFIWIYFVSFRAVLMISDRKACCDLAHLHGSGMSHATTSCPEPSFRAASRASDAMFGRGNTRWTASKCGHPRPCQNCSQRPSAEKTRRGSLLNPLSCPADDLINQGTELNWTACWLSSQIWTFFILFSI